MKRTATAAKAATTAPAVAAVSSPANTTNLVVAKETSHGLSVVDLEHGHFPDLSQAHTVPFDLMSDYWTPETVGESKKLIFDTIRRRQVKSLDSDEIVELDCAFFFEQVGPEKTVRTVCNGSKRLVGVIEGYQLQRGTPLLVTFMGKQKNRSNNFKSDIWSVKPLVINLENK